MRDKCMILTTSVSVKEYCLHHVKDQVETGHLTNFDAFRLMTFKKWFEIHAI